jgi:hypothetical protein
MPSRSSERHSNSVIVRPLSLRHGAAVFPLRQRSERRLVHASGVEPANEKNLAVLIFVFMRRCGVSRREIRCQSSFHHFAQVELCATDGDNRLPYKVFCLARASVVGTDSGHAV